LSQQFLFGNAGPVSTTIRGLSGDSKILNEGQKDNPMISDVSPSGPAAPETPAQKPASRKTLYLVLGGVCVFLCLCLCLVATVAGVYGLSTLSSGGGLGGGRRAANATWQIDVKSIRSSMTGISDSTGGSVTPKSGYTFIIVTATVKNVSGESKSFFLSAGNSDAKLGDKNGDLLDLAAVKKGDSVNINFANQVQMMFVYADQETWEFYFVALQNDRGPFTFTFMDLSPLGPLSLP
jgi:hypothetical protein